MGRSISIAYQANGSVVCNGGVDPSRTATFPGPKNSAAQLANIAAFYAAEPYLPDDVSDNPGEDLANRADPGKGAAMVGYRYGTVAGQFDILQRRPKNLHAAIISASIGTPTAARIVATGDSLAVITLMHILPALDRKMGGVGATNINSAGSVSGMGPLSAGADLSPSTTTGSVVDETTQYQYWPTGLVTRMDAGSTQLFVRSGATPNFTRVRLYYIKEPGAGTVNFVIGGAAQAAVDASLGAGSTPTLGVLEYNQAYGPATVSVAVSGAPVRRLFVHVENQGASGADLYATMGTGGLLLADAVSSPQGVAIWQAALAAISPTLVGFQMNDDFAFNGDGASSAAFQTYATMLEAACPNADKIIIGSPPRLTNDNAKEASRSWLRNQCQLRNSSWIFWDGYAPLGSYPEQNAVFPGSDGEHLTAAANTFLASQLWEFLGLSSGSLGFSPSGVNAPGVPSVLGKGTLFQATFPAASGSALKFDCDAGGYDFWFSPTISTRAVGLGGTSITTCQFVASGNTGIRHNVIPNSFDFYGTATDVGRRNFSFATLGGKEVAKWGNTSAATGYQTHAFEEIMLAKMASAAAPGAGFGKLAFVAGTNAGTAKLVAYAGTSSTPVTIVDNIGAGF